MLHVKHNALRLTSGTSFISHCIHYCVVVPGACWSNDATAQRRVEAGAALAPVDFDQARREVAPAIEAEEGLQVALAKAEAWALIGERAKGTPLVALHVFGGAS